MWRIAVYPFLFLIVFLISLSLYGFWVSVKPPKYVTNLTPSDLGWEYEEVTLTTSDGVKLSSWFVPRGSTAFEDHLSYPTIVMLHGYPADKGDILYWSEFLHDEYNLLFFDFRSLGESDGAYTSLGYHEQKDLEAAISYLNDKNIDTIGVMGFSMGGAVGMLTAVENPAIRAVVSESSFARLDIMARDFYSPFSFFKYPLAWLTNIWARVFLGVEMTSVSPEKAAEQMTTPIFLIHPKNDDVISYSHGTMIYEGIKNHPDAQFFFPDKGTHGGYPPEVREEYEEKVLEFFKKYLR